MSLCSSPLRLCPLRGTGEAGRNRRSEPFPGGSSQSLATTGYPNGSLSGCSIQMPSLKRKREVDF